MRRETSRQRNRVDLPEFPGHFPCETWVQVAQTGSQLCFQGTEHFSKPVSRVWLDLSGFSKLSARLWRRWGMGRRVKLWAASTPTSLKRALVTSPQYSLPLTPALSKDF